MREYISVRGISQRGSLPPPTQCEATVISICLLYVHEYTHIQGLLYLLLVYSSFEHEACGNPTFIGGSQL